MINRYYTQYDSTDPLINNRGWKIYDHTLTYGRGDPLPLAFCYNKETADKIVNLLNNNQNPWKIVDR